MSNQIRAFVETRLGKAGFSERSSLRKPWIAVPLFGGIYRRPGVWKNLPGVTREGAQGPGFTFGGEPPLFWGVWPWCFPLERIPPLGAF